MPLNGPVCRHRRQKFSHAIQRPQVDRPKRSGHKVRKFPSIVGSANFISSSAVCVLLGWSQNKTANSDTVLLVGGDRPFHRKLWQSRGFCFQKVGKSYLRKAVKQNGAALRPPAKSLVFGDFQFKQTLNPKKLKSHGTGWLGAAKQNCCFQVKRSELRWPGLPCQRLPASHGHTSHGHISHRDGSGELGNFGARGARKKTELSLGQVVAPLEESSCRRI